MKTTHTPEEIAKRIAELPEPLREKPKKATAYYCAYTNSQVYQYKWYDGTTDNLFLDSYACFATIEHAQAHADFRKWLYEKPKLTIEECWTTAFNGCAVAEYTATQAAAKFIQLARDNGHL